MTISVSKPPCILKAPVLAIALVSTALASCSGGGSDSCDDVDFSQFDNEVIVTGIEQIEAFKRQGDGSLQLADSTVVTSISELELHVSMAYTRQPRESASGNWSLLNWLVGNAHACTLPPYEGDINSRVTDVNLMSNADFADAFSAGTSLNTAFEIEEREVEGIVYGYSQSPQRASMSDYVVEGVVTAAVEYVLTARASVLAPTPADSGYLHQFTFSIMLDTGEMFTAMTEAVLLEM